MFRVSFLDAALETLPRSVAKLFRVFSAMAVERRFCEALERHYQIESRWTPIANRAAAGLFGSRLIDFL
jgi:hypothetical protein